VAQKFSFLLDDDQTGGPAERTIRFAFEGTDYEIDLNTKNAAKFSKQLAPYLEHAHRTGRARADRPGRRQAASAWVISGPGPKGTAPAVSERGRIHASVVEQYNVAGGR